MSTKKRVSVDLDTEDYEYLLNQVALTKKKPKIQAEIILQTVIRSKRMAQIKL